MVMGSVISTWQQRSRDEPIDLAHKKATLPRMEGDFIFWIDPILAGFGL